MLNFVILLFQFFYSTVFFECLIRSFSANVMFYSSRFHVFTSGTSWLNAEHLPLCLSKGESYWIIYSQHLEDRVLWEDLKHRDATQVQLLEIFHRVCIAHTIVRTLLYPIWKSFGLRTWGLHSSVLILELVRTVAERGNAAVTEWTNTGRPSG